MANTYLPLVIKRFNLSTTATKLKLYTDDSTVSGDTALTYNDGDNNVTVNQTFRKITVTNHDATANAHINISRDPSDINTFTSTTAPGSDGTYQVSAGATVVIEGVSIARLRMVAGSDTPKVTVKLEF